MLLKLNLQFFASKKGGGSTKNGRDSESKRLGAKAADGQFVTAGSILYRQRGTKILPGTNVMRGGDDTLFTTVSGIVKFERVGKDKKLFNMYKFRSMRTDTPHDMPTHLLNDPEAFITKVGKFLRKTSLDELPQLFNILKGDMSIVGPRPALWNQDDLIAERDKYKANSIRPGLTGWAQVNGRDELEIPVKAKFDGEYVEKMSLPFDIRCIINTALQVIKHEGVVEGGTGTLTNRK